MLDFLYSLILFVLGALVVFATLASAVRSFVLPRAENVPLTRWVFINMNRLFRLRVNRLKTYEARDRAMAFFAPVTLMVLVAVWLTCIIIGYMFMFRAAGISPWMEAFRYSGSSLLTLGSVFSEDFLIVVLIFSEAAIGLGIVALLISYLPTMYGAFSRRETRVALLEVMAGSPPSPVEFLQRTNRIGGFERLPEVWHEWELWFTELEESHTSLAPLMFFRSPQPDRHWVTASGVVLDSASLLLSSVDIEWQVDGALCIRAGYVALRSIGDYFDMNYNRSPVPGDLISISRQEFDDAFDALKAAGLPMKEDREQAWVDFSGWRVNYDAVLLQLALLFNAPYAMWVSDRSRPSWM